MRIINLFFLVAVLHVNLFSQLPEFTAPVDFPIVLNGNFGELRTNHFHAGIDIKTNGETGLPVYSIDDGYISRIAVSPSGYGKAIYIDHPNGYTSVYAHLDGFTEPVAEWVKKEQYRLKTYRVNLYPEKNQFKFKNGDIIAYSGNSGSSDGPHLHFEIRKTSNQNPVNPQKFNFGIEDQTNPVVENLCIYPLSDSSHVENATTKKYYNLVFYDGAYHIKGKPTIEGFGELGFGIDAIDYIDGNWSKCGIYQMEYWVDNQLVNAFQIDQLQYSKMRDINSHIDYEAAIERNEKYHKTFIEPGNKLDIYKQTRNRGIFNFNNGKRHTVSIVFFDINMNSAKIEFTLRSTKPVAHPKIKTVAFFQYNEENKFTDDEIDITLPPNALYNDLHFIYKKGKTPPGAFSSLHRVHRPFTPLDKAIDIAVKPVGLPEKLYNKALLAHFDIKKGTYSAIGGEFINGKVISTTMKFGDVCVVADTIPPKIDVLSFKNNQLMEPSRIRFKIEDELSGVDNYNVFIDGKWILFSYDMKRDMLEYIFDENIEKGKTHQLRLEVTDKKNNLAVFETSFYY
ncbi:MAG: M23 family metallopeptidase [Prolixibacteraceae bacterium]|nr:M23 family metallopeptidase [Prolixibacteraceae bacterium]